MKKLEPLINSWVNEVSIIINEICNMINGNTEHDYQALKIAGEAIIKWLLIIGLLK